MKQQTLSVLSLFLIGCGSLPVESTDQKRTLPQVPASLENDEDEQNDKPKFYNETGALPSTPEDWERVGVPKFSSANLSEEEIAQVIRAAKQQLEKEKSSKSVSPTDTSGSTSALSALKGTTGVNATGFTMNGISGSQIDLGLPVYVQLKGSVDQGKSTDGTTGFVAYKVGNSALGVVQSYANSGAGFNANSSHREISIIAAHAFGSFFVEGQLGSVSATDVNLKDWSGVRTQVKLGIDSPFGAPFVQLTHRDFGSSSDTSSYVGFELANAEFKADTYAFSTTMLTKLGHHSIHGSTGSVDLNATLNLKSGVGFNTSLSIGSTVESKAAINVSLDR